MNAEKQKTMSKYWLSFVTTLSVILLSYIILGIIGRICW